jgi:hypothetical protein
MVHEHRDGHGQGTSGIPQPFVNARLEIQALGDRVELGECGSMER